MAVPRVTQSVIELITVSPSNPPRVTQSVIELLIGGLLAVVECNSPPIANLSVSYNHQFTVSNGTGNPPFVFSISAGSLPTGLTMDSTGLVTGVPTVLGTFNFTVQVVDATPRTSTVACSIAVVGGQAATFSAGTASLGHVFCHSPDKLRQFERSAEYLRERLKGRQEFPWDHLMSPVTAQNVNQVRSIVAPAVSVNFTPVLQYQVPVGMRFFLQGIVQDYEGGLFSPGSAIWTVDQNAAADSLQGAGVNGLISLPVPLGSFEDGVIWVFDRSYEFEPQTLVRSTVRNVALPSGPGNYFTSAFLGYIVPV